MLHATPATSAASAAPSSISRCWSDHRLGSYGGASVYRSWEVCRYESPEAEENTGYLAMVLVPGALL